MAKICIGFVKWFAESGIVVKLSALLISMGGVITGVTWLLISNYKAQSISDKETIRTLQIRLDVKDAVYTANENRKDSIFQIQINNERLATKAYIDQVLKVQEEMKQQLLEQLNKK